MSTDITDLRCLVYIKSMSQLKNGKILIILVCLKKTIYRKKKK